MCPVGPNSVAPLDHGVRCSRSACCVGCIHPSVVVGPWLLWVHCWAGLYLPALWGSALTILSVSIYEACPRFKCLQGPAVTPAGMLVGWPVWLWSLDVTAAGALMWGRPLELVAVRPSLYSCTPVGVWELTPFLSCLTVPGLVPLWRMWAGIGGESWLGRSIGKCQAG